MMDKETRFTSLLEANKDRIYRLCLCYVRDADASKDVYQEVLFHLWKSLDSFEGRSQVSTWVYRVTVNTCLGYLRAEKRRDGGWIARRHPGNPWTFHCTKESDMNWEYKTVKVPATGGLLGGKFDGVALIERLNELGGQRWGLVAVSATHQGYGQSRGIVAIFKREKS
jgi:Sigma-70 region 2/Domain of unknown function (DUF4177)